MIVRLAGDGAVAQEVGHPLAEVPVEVLGVPVGDGREGRRGVEAGVQHGSHADMNPP